MRSDGHITKYLNVSLLLPLHMFVDSPSTTTLGVQFSSLSVAFIGTQYNPHVCCLVMACVSLPVRVLCFAEFSGTLPANFNFFCCYLRLAATFLCSVWDSFSETNWLYDGDWLDWQYGKKLLFIASDFYDLIAAIFVDSVGEGVFRGSFRDDFWLDFVSIVGRNFYVFIRK